jgi:hypothetical protein
MRRHLALVITTAVLVAGLGVSVYARRGDTDLRARLRGLNEVPPTNSPGSAALSATLSPDESTITFTLDFQGLTANPGAAHIHFGPPRVNGGVMVFFCGGGGKPACPASTSGTVTGTITAADIVGPAAQGIPAAPAGQFADVVRAIRTGNSYANMHSTNFPGGEIRGPVRVVGFDLNGHDDDDDD